MDPMMLARASFRARAARVASLSSLVLVLAEAHALAQPSTPPEGATNAEDRRTQLYREATEAAAAGRWSDARDRLTEAVAIRSSPKLLFSLAQAEERLGAIASAHADYVRALEGARAAGQGEVVQAAEQATAALEPRVPRVRVVATGVGDDTPPGATATLDDRPMPLGVAVSVDPGAHRVVVRAPGMREVTSSVAIGERQQLEVPVRLVAEGSTLALGPVPPPAPVSVVPGPLAATVAAATPPSSLGPWRTVALIVAGAGLVGVGIGAGFGGVSISKHSAAEASCPGVTCPTAGGSGLWSDAVTTGNVSTGAFIAGGVALVAGGVLWLVAPRSQASTAQVGVGLGSVNVSARW